jgi:hypothetical protein
VLYCACDTAVHVLYCACDTAVHVLYCACDTAVHVLYCACDTAVHVLYCACDTAVHVLYCACDTAVHVLYCACDDPPGAWIPPTTLPGPVTLAGTPLEAPQRTLTATVYPAHWGTPPNSRKLRAWQSAMVGRSCESSNLLSQRQHLPYLQIAHHKMLQGAPCKAAQQLVHSQWQFLTTCSAAVTATAVAAAAMCSLRPWLW